MTSRKTTVEVITSEYVRSHGREPRGFGSWAFNRLDLHLPLYLRGGPLVRTYVIFRDGGWWRKDPTGRFDGGWTLNCGDATAYERADADRLARRIGGEVVPVEMAAEAVAQ